MSYFDRSLPVLINLHHFSLCILTNVYDAKPGMRLIIICNSTWENKVFSTHVGNMGVEPKDGIEAAIHAWSQLQHTTVVDSASFFPHYLHHAGGHVDAVRARRNREGTHMADQFFHDVRPDPPRHLGLPRTSDLIHPTFRMVTTQSCRCTEGDEFDEKVVLINIAFPRISLQNSINEYLDSATMPRCRHCNQFRREVTRRRLIHATPVIAVAFQRVSYETG